jgi:mycothiol synthase
VTPAGPTVETTAAVSETDQARIVELAASAERADGVGPLSEHAWLHLRRGGGPDLLARGPNGRIEGYAHLDGAEAELVVDPERRRRGHGRALLHALEQSAGAELRVWAHGDRPPAAALAAASGYVRVRELWQMQRAPTVPLPDERALDGLRLRAFRPGQDEDAWLGVNGRAFAAHPEQGGWTMTDLSEREASDWFDPAGLIVAEAPDGAMAGFHWTKEHREPGKDPVGEVYVLAVDPAYQGRGLASALTIAGLRHLARRGLETVLLYVDGDNEPAIATYRRMGFERVALDVMYGRG